MALNLIPCPPSARHQNLRKPMAAAMLCLAVMAVATLTPAPANAQWMWRGADGRMTASDRPPPPQVAEKDILRRPSADALRVVPKSADPASAAESTGGKSSAGAAPAPTTALDKELAAKKQAAELERASQAKAEEAKAAAVRETNCRSARGQAATLESGMRMARTNDKGEREILDDRARSEELRRAREVMASDCR